MPVTLAAAGNKPELGETILDNNRPKRALASYNRPNNTAGGSLRATVSQAHGCGAESPVQSRLRWAAAFGARPLCGPQPGRPEANFCSGGASVQRMAGQAVLDVQHRHAPRLGGANGLVKLQHPLAVALWPGLCRRLAGMPGLRGRGIRRGGRRFA